MKDEMRKDCESKTGLSYSLDKLYLSGQQTLCSQACPCNAKTSLWSDEVQATMTTDISGASELD